MVIKHYDGDGGKLLHEAAAILPRGASPTPPSPPAPPKPPAPPAPPPPSGNWECVKNKVTKHIGTDKDLKGTGDDITSCEKACLQQDDCFAIYWHRSDKH